MVRKLGICLAAIAVLAIAPSAASAASFAARGSVEQVYATGLPGGARVSLLDGSSRVLQTHTANSLGGALFRGVAPGGGYRVRLDSGGEESDPLTVMSTQSAPPSNAVYNQTVHQDGYGYMDMRDGTKLAYSVHPPTDVTDVAGLHLPDNPLLDLLPSPTLIEYSGYGYANPAGPQSGIAALANLMGYTVVDVNMRGTGCSGGAFDFFEPLQGLDGYDVIETVARQPWVAHSKVGMLGISYGGISQLFTAQTQPPSLAAITPLSVIDQTQTTLYPGGTLNTGFAFNWAKERVHDAQVSGPDAGQGWAYKRIQEGDSICAANQAMHPEAVDLLGKVRANDHYVPEVADPLAPVTFVNKINVPVFMACQFTDEQTGGHCPTLAEHMTGTNKKWFTFTNGTHTDSLSPETFNRLYDFLELYVAQEPPLLKSLLVRATAPLAFQAISGIDGMTAPQDPIQEIPTYDQAKAAFEAQKPIRVLYDNGAGRSPGQPYPGFERSYDSFPVPGTWARSWYLGSDGTLNDGPPPAAAADGFSWDLHSRPPTDFTGDTGSGAGGLWTASPQFNWAQDPHGNAVAYVTQPLGQDMNVLGAGAVDVWVRSSQPNVDLQATVSEVRPDGKETFVQGGWVRGKARALDPNKSSELEPVLSLRQEDFAPLPSRSFTKVTIPLYYEGHMYRAGSRLRIRIGAPNGDQPIWAFDEAEGQGADIAIAHGPDMPSRLLLPVVPGATAPTPFPPCPGLRNEPCRAFQPYSNEARPLKLPKKKKCKAKKHAVKKHSAKKHAAKKHKKQRRACAKKHKKHKKHKKKHPRR
jgi:uncharacterized protein